MILYFKDLLFKNHIKGKGAWKKKCTENCACMHSFLC